MTRPARLLIGTAAVPVCGAVVGWSAYAALTWLTYGRRRCRPAPAGLIDRYLPTCEVGECHQIGVAAPAATTYAAVRELDLNESAAIRAVFRFRELLMGGERHREDAGSLLAQTLALGWDELAEEPGREIVVGAVTQPWRANVRFRSLPPEQFAEFNEPGYAKIVWTLAAEPTGPETSVFRTETRVATTDPPARRRFRLYWSIFSPGILLIRSRSLRLVKAEAERRHRERHAGGLARTTAATAGEAGMEAMEAV